MKKPNLLVVVASPRGERSRSRRAGAEFVSGWRNRNPDGEVTIRDLLLHPPSFVSEAWVEGAFGPPEGRSAAAAVAIAESDYAVDQLLAADEIVIATPMYNLSVPAVLKAWIDQIVRFGRTFRFGPEGYVGLMADKPVKVLVVSGGDLRPGAPAANLNFLEPYLRAVMGIIGLKDVEFHYTVNQSASPEIAEKALSEGLEEALLAGSA